MVVYSDAQNELISKYNPEDKPDLKNLGGIPPGERRYKCRSCFTAGITTDDLVGDACPVCGDDTSLDIVCPLDHCHCHHDVVETIAYCPLCGHAMCPVCGCHDVSQLSRITGYIGDISGWNNGKAQELKDRVRYQVATDR